MKYYCCCLLFVWARTIHEFLSSYQYIGMTSGQFALQTEFFRIVNFAHSVDFYILWLKLAIHSHEMFRDFQIGRPAIMCSVNLYIIHIFQEMRVKKRETCINETAITFELNVFFCWLYDTMTFFSVCF